MRFEHSFVVDLPVGEAWDVLVDLERVAGCLPGAELHAVHGDEYAGSVSVRLGMMTAGYAGRARLTEVDPIPRRIVVKATGTESQGSGRASAKVTATLREEDDATRVDVTTDLNISGRVAQLGRGMLANVSAKLLDEFVANLERELHTVDSSTGPPDAERQPEPVNLLALRPRPQVRRVGSVALGIAAAILLASWFGRRYRGRARRTPRRRAGKVLAWRTPAAR